MAELVGLTRDGRLEYASTKPHECDETCRSCPTCYRRDGLTVCDRACVCAQAVRNWLVRIRLRGYGGGAD